MLTLSFGDNSLGAVQSLEVERKADVAGALERWRAVIEIGGATAVLAEETARTLETQLAGTAALKILSDGVETRVLAVAACRQGPALERVEVLTRDPAAAHERRRVSVTFVATLQDADEAVQLHTFTVAVVAKAGEPTVLVTRGKVILRSGEDPATHESVIVVVATGYRRVRREITRDAAVPGLDYVVEDRQVFAALPQGVEEGSYSRAVVSDGAGRREIVRGFFVGPSTRARAEELATPFAAGTTRFEENPFSRRVDFEFSAAIAADNNPAVVSLAEQVSLTWKRQVVDHAILGNQPRYRQIIGAPWTEVVQSGNAAGESAPPSAPAPLHSNEMIEREVAHAGNETRWRYVFRLLTGFAE